MTLIHFLNVPQLLQLQKERVEFYYLLGFVKCQLCDFSSDLILVFQALCSDFKKLPYIALYIYVGVCLCEYTHMCVGTCAQTLA